MMRIDWYISSIVDGDKCENHGWRTQGIPPVVGSNVFHRTNELKQQTFKVVRVDHCISQNTISRHDIPNNDKIFSEDFDKTISEYIQKQFGGYYTGLIPGLRIQYTTHRIEVLLEPID